MENYIKKFRTLKKASFINFLRFQRGIRAWGKIKVPRLFKDRKNSWRAMEKYTHINFYEGDICSKQKNSIAILGSTGSIGRTQAFRIIKTTS